MYDARGPSLPTPTVKSHSLNKLADLLQVHSAIDNPVTHDDESIHKIVSQNCLLALYSQIPTS